MCSKFEGLNQKPVSCISDIIKNIELTGKKLNSYPAFYYINSYQEVNLLYEEPVLTDCLK